MSNLTTTLHFHDPILGEKTYYLRVDSIDHNFTSLPAQSGLPGVETEQAPVITIDLGVCVPQITVSGIVNSVSTGINDPSKSDLEHVVLEWWRYGDDTTTLPQLTLPGGAIYPVSTKIASFHIDGALEDRWQFSITWLVSVPVS
jgi:hypothetical protein